MVPHRSPFSEGDIVLAPSRVREIMLKVLKESKNDVLNIVKELKIEMREKLNMGGRYALVLIRGDDAPYNPFLSFYVSDDSKCAVILTTSNPSLSGEILINLNEKFDPLEKALLRILGVYGKDISNPTFKSVVLTRYCIPPSLAYAGDERFLKERILDEKLDDRVGLLTLMELDEEGIDTILMDVGRMLWDFILPTFNFDEIVLTLKYPEDVKLESPILFEISRYLRKKLAEMNTKIREASIPSNLRSMKPLISFSTHLRDYPRLKDELKALSSIFIDKLKRISNFIENEGKNWEKCSFR